MKPNYKLSNIDPLPTLFLTLTPVAAVVLTTMYVLSGNFSWWSVVLFVAFYTITAMSITGGYHRLFSHKSYEASAFVRLMYALFGAAAFQNSILKWATDHRIHHRFVDSDKDPYSINKGFLYAHIGWMLFKEEQHPHFKAYQRDLVNDKIVMWQDKYYVPIAIFMGLIFPGLLGWLMFDSFLGGLALGGFLRLVCVHHGTFLINSLSHWWGAQTYTDQNTARDNLFTAFLTFGEGYHNFHHLFANDYRNGIKWYHWDPTKWLIKFKAKLGLVSGLKKTPEEEILKAKLIMDEKRLAKKVSGDQLAQWQTHLEEMKRKLLEAQTRISKLKQEYVALKLAKTNDCKKRMEEVKKEWQRAKSEWMISYKIWRLTLKRASLAFPTYF